MKRPLQQDAFWLRQLRRLIEREQAGVDPSALINRGMVLSLMASMKGKVSLDVPETVHHYLDDFDIAAKDLAKGSTVYRDHQITSVEKWLNNG